MTGGCWVQVGFTEAETEAIRRHLAEGSVPGWLHDLAVSAVQRADDAGGGVLLLCPTCLHDQVLDRMMTRAEDAEARVAALRDLCAIKGIRLDGEDLLKILGGGEPAHVEGAAALRAYLAAHGWAEQPPGPAGSIFTLPDMPTRVSVGAPFDDKDPFLLRAAIERLARAEGRTVAETATAVLAEWRASHGHS